MMLPALVIVGFGRRRRVGIPFPVFLLWPVWALAWLVWIFLRVLRAPGEKPLGAVLMLSARLSGTLIDVRSREGDDFYLRMI